MSELYFKPVFVFSKKVSNVLSNAMIREFVSLREFAVSQLNPKYEEWNDAYEGIGGVESDDYLRYIQSKTKEVLDKVNRTHLTIYTELDCDEMGDIIARNKQNKNITMTMELIPVNKA